MRTHWKLLALVILVSWGAYHHWQRRPVMHGPGIVADTLPQQQAIRDAQAFDFKGYHIQPLADFNLEARVLSTEHYRLGREADLSPVDLALGWGRMSDDTVLARIVISQSNRFYFWRTDDFPIPRAPQSSALFAGSPLANRSVFSTSTSRIRSTPLSSDISTRLTRATGASRRPSGCQT